MAEKKRILIWKGHKQMDVLEAKSNKDYMKCAALIGLPVVMQNLVSAMVNTLDVFMLGQLGETAITAASLSNQWFLLYCILANGIASAGAMFMSQHYGQKDYKSIHGYMGILLYGTVGLALFFTVCSFFMPQTVLGFYSLDPSVIKEGAAYLRIIGISFLLYAINLTASTALRSIGSTRVPMAASMASLLCNACLNYLLIFGSWGFPRMGVQGAAIATVCARVLEVVVTVGYVIIKKPPVYGKAAAYLRIPEIKIRKFFRYGFLVILGEVVYAIGNNLYNVAYKFCGTQAQASLQIIQTIQGMALLFCGGFGTAAAVMLGTLLGNNEFEKAKSLSRKLTILAVAAAAAAGAAAAILSPFFIPIFSIEEKSAENIRIMVIIMACSIPLRTMVYMSICGILRSGGDNLSCFMANLFGVWCVGLPAVFLAAVYFHAPVYMVYMMSITEEAGKLILCGPRVMKGKWLCNLTQ